AIVIVDHSRKMGGDAIDVVSGSTGKTAAPDCVITLQRQAGGTSLLSVIPRDAEQQTYQMKLYGEGDADHSFGWGGMVESCTIFSGDFLTLSPQSFLHARLSLISGRVPERPGAVKGAPAFGAAERTLDGEDRSETISKKGKGGAQTEKVVGE